MKMTNSPVAILAEPYSQQEIADLEQLIFASQNEEPKTRLTARAFLAQFVNTHGKAKGDMMMEKLSVWHDKPQRPDA
jgi:hypothetical protein